MGILSCHGTGASVTDFKLIAFHGVLDMSLAHKAYMRDAAYMVAIDRVVKAMQIRGWV